MDQGSHISNAVERLLVREVLEHYLATLDKQDWEGIASCFTEDCTSHYNNQPEALQGRVPGGGVGGR